MTTDVAAPLHVSTTFRYPSDPAKLQPAADLDVDTAVTPTAAHTLSHPHIYSRISAPSTTRLEATLSTLLGGYAVTYASGLAAFHALLVHVNPRRLLIGQAYHGCHGVAALMKRLTGMEIMPLDTPPQPGDLVHLETPMNPTGEATSIAVYAARARAAGALLSVDSTFAPPPLQVPLELGAHWLMHSGTKYIGGHSDMLAGVLVTVDANAARALYLDRMYLGNVMGSFEGWLGLRSVRTLELRVLRQSTTATALARWIDAEWTGKAVDRVLHASLQPQEDWLTQQMPRGFGPVFAVLMKTEAAARSLPSNLKLWMHATSLGGVESLVEWRAMSDAGCDRRLLRFSVGVEAEEDLRADLDTAFKAVAAM